MKQRIYLYDGQFCYELIISSRAVVSITRSMIGSDLERPVRFDDLPESAKAKIQHAITNGQETQASS